MNTSIRLRLNGNDVAIETVGGGTLLWALRTSQGLTETKYGCGAGMCGACTVLVDGKAVRSCITPLASVSGKSVTTVEGLADGSRLDPVRQAFVDHDALQCGFCTPGLLRPADEADAFRRAVEHLRAGHAPR